MNKLRYRIVFNKTRGMLMVVQETARSHGRGAGVSGKLDSTVPPAMALPALRRVALMLGVPFGGMLIAGAAFAQMVADPNAPGKQRATVLEAANGVPQIDIQTPSAAGVSRNVFTQFDVGTNGAILNNSRTAVQTQLGGWVQGNPWLATGSARVILNEVNSSNPSHLKGYIEVAGQRAETVIANPAGIVVNGGGFINVSRATLTTGNPLMNGDVLTGYSVQRGRIVIEGAGLDASRTDYTALIARSVQLNAGVWAQKLNVIGGAAEVAEDGTARQATVPENVAEAAPVYAIDVARLGGMYANHIYLVGTEAGVGVRNAGTIGAAAGDLIVTSSGRLENSGSLAASGRVQAKADVVDNTGQMNAGADLFVTAGGLRNAGEFNATGDAVISLTSDADNREGSIEARRLDVEVGGTLLNDHGRIAQSGTSTLVIDAARVVNTGELGRESLPVPAPGTLEGGGTSGESASPIAGNDGGTPVGGAPTIPEVGSVLMPLPDGRIKAQLVDNGSGLVNANSGIVVRTGELHNRGGKASLNSLSVYGTSLDNTSGLLSLRGDLSASTNNFVNTQGKVVVGGKLVGVHSVLSNSQGLLQAGLLALDVGGQFDNEAGTVRQTGGATANLSIDGELRQGGGTLDIASGLVMSTGALSGTGGVLNIHGDLVLNSGATSAHGGAWTIGANARLRTGDLDSRDGSIAVGGTLALSASSIDNAGGKILSEGDTSLAASGTLSNRAGHIRSGGDLNVTAGRTLANDAGKIESTGSAAKLHVGAATIANGSGSIVNTGTGTTLLTAETVTSRGVMGGNGVVEISANRLINEEQGRIVGADDVNLGVNVDLVNAGNIASGGTLAMMQPGARLLNQGSIVSQGDLFIVSSAIDNTGGAIATATGSDSALLLQTGSLRNDGGTLQSDANVRLDIVGVVSNHGGRIRSGQDLALTTGGSLENREGAIEATGKLELRAHDVRNAGGSILGVGTGQTVLNIVNGIDSDGQIGANGDLRILAGTLDNGAAGSISTKGELVFDVRDSVTNRGVISSAGKLDFDQDQAGLVNSGTISSGEAARLTLDVVDNVGGTIETRSGARVTLTANTLHNRDGQIVASGTASITVGTVLDNTTGGLRASGALDVSAGGALHNQGGTIELGGAQATLAVQAASIDSRAGRIVNAGTGDTRIRSATDVSNSGTLSGNGRVELDAATLINLTEGSLAAGGPMELRVTQQFDNAGAISSAGALTLDQAATSIANRGSITAAGRITLHGSSIDNDGGEIATQSGSDIVLVSLSSLTNNGGIVAATGNAVLNAQGAFDNSDGLVQTAGRLKLVAAGALTNSGGNLEAVGPTSTLELAAESIDNSGRIVNVGSGASSIEAVNVIANSGTIAGSGAFGLHATALHNAASGSIVSGGPLALGLRQAFNNHGGTISSSSTLRFDGIGASFSNSGRIGAGGLIDIAAMNINNDGGRLYTVSGLGAAITLQTGDLGNLGGSITADGSIALRTSGDIFNDGGSLHSGRDLTLEAGGRLDNGAGVVETAAGSLDVRTQSIESGGRIVNAGVGPTTLSSTGDIVNRGTIAGNGTLTVQAASLQNRAGAQLASGGDLELDVRQQLSNAGSVSSGRTLSFEQPGAMLANSGQIASAGNASFRVASFDNDSGTISTVKGSGAAIAVTSSSLDNRNGKILADGRASFELQGGVDNSGGTVQAGRDLVLDAAGSLANNGGTIEALGADSAVTIDSAAIDNAGGRISNAGSGDMRISASAGITNDGTIAAMGDLALAGQHLQNGATGTIAAGGNLDLAITRQWINQGKANSGGTLTFNQAGASFANSGEVIAGAHAYINVAQLNNDGGRLGTSEGSGADLTLHTQELSNAGGRIATDRDLSIVATGMTGSGELFGGRDLSLATQGDYVQWTGGQLRSNRDLSLIVSGNITNASVFEAARNLNLSGQHITNQEGATIEAQGVTLRAVGNLVNAGEINGAATLDIGAAHVTNTSGIVGGDVTLNARNLDNSGGAALIGATGDLEVGVAGTLNNVGGATLYSSGDMHIGGLGEGSTSLVNNNSSTIEAGASLALNAVTLTNERENVQITKVKTLDETRRMNMPSWYQFGDNHSWYEPSAANYSPHEIYFVNPADILEETPYVTPDGYSIVRAVIRTHANDSAYFVARSGLYGAYGTQQRLATTERTRVIYYTQREQLANPDQGGAASNLLLIGMAADVSEWDATISFSNQYGSCSSECIRLVTESAYADPTTTILRFTQRMLAPRKEALELWRDAHHTVVEDQIAPGSGAAAQILSGGDMHLSVSNAIVNSYGNIRARGSLSVDGRPAITNEGATLYRTHTFDGIWRSYGGTTTAYSQPSISEVIGTTRGIIEGEQGVSISARSFNNVDVTAGTAGNIRDRVEVIGSGASGAASVGMQATVGTGRAGTLEGSTGASSWASNAPLAAAESVSGHAFKDGMASAAAALLGRVVTGNVRSAAGVVIAQEVSQVRGETLGKLMKVAPGGLFIRNPDANGSYLFETRPQFANQQEWISSAYLLEQLSHSATLQKRLGDGFYEQRLVREQLSELTGHTSRGGASDDSVYRELLSNAVSFARAFNLRPGIALSAEQISHLTSDIVWLEDQAVQLPDGSVDTVLVPKVYLAHVGKQALQAGGALVTGASVTIGTTEDIVNSGGVIDGGNGRTLLAAGRDIANQGGKIAGGSVGLAAERDIRNETLTAEESFATDHNRGSYTTESNRAEILAADALDIQAGRDLVDLAGTIKAGTAEITAERDVNFGTVRTGSTYEHVVGGYTQSDSSTAYQLSQLSTGGDLNIRAGGNLSLTGTQVAIGISGAGNGRLLAGGMVNITSVTNEVNTSLQNDSSSKNYDKRVYSNETVIGANVASSGNLVVGAGIAGQGSVNVVASGLNAGDALRVFATDNVNIVSAQENHLSDTASTHSSSSFLRSKTKEQSDYVVSSLAVGSGISGKTVELNAGKDINVLGSSIAGEGDVDLAARGNVIIGAATSTVTEKHHTKVKESGFLSGGGFGISYGTRTTTTDHNRDATTQSGQSRSMVGSIDGNLNVSAGDALKISGSDLSAGQDISLSGKSVAITAGTDDVNDKFTTKMTQTGLTLAIGGSVVNAIQTAQGMSSAASQTSNGRVKALAAAAAAMTAKDAAKDLAQNGPSARISLTVGRSESESMDLASSRKHGGSVLAAGDNVTIRATGGNNASNIDIIGSDVRAAGNVLLRADNQINLLAAQDTESQHSQSKSWSAAVGLAAEINSQGASYGITASASASRSKIDGEGITQANSHVDAGNRLTIVSGGDTNLKGAVANGAQVVTEVGGNLNIESLQDTAKLDGKQQSLSVSGTFGAAAGFSASASQSKVHNDYASVQEQSGIRAGDGGFQIQVGGNTDLKGGVISSSEQAISDGRNRLVTTTLSSSDIQNRDSHNASGVSLGVNIGKNQSGDTFSPSMAPGTGTVSGSQSSVTRSGVSEGTLTVVDGQAEQAVASLNRDVITGRDTAEALAKGWNSAQALAEVDAQMQIISAAMPRLANGIGNYAKTRMEELKSQGNTEEAAKWAEGGIYRVAAHTALGAMGGGLDGAVGAAAAAEMAPTIDELQRALTVRLTGVGLGDNAAEVAARLITGGTAGLIGGSVSGNRGAAAGMNADANNRQLHPDETTWIKENAARFAAEKGISVDEATKRLAQQASREIDLVWRGVLSDTVDKEAQSFLMQTQEQTFNNGFGQKQALFTTQDRQFTAAQHGFFELDKSFMSKYVTPYGSRRALEGVWAEIGQSATSIVDTVKRDPVGVVVQTGRSLAVGARDALWHPIDTVTSLIKSAESGAKTFGEGVAASTNNNIQNQLNILYGQDVTKAIQLVTSAQGVEMLGSAFGAGKAGSNLFDGIAGALKKSGDTKSILANGPQKVNQTSNNFYRDGASPVAALSTSGGIVIRADPGKTTTVLGTFRDDMQRIINTELEYPKSMGFLDPKPGGFNVLNTPDDLYNTLGPDRFWREVNVPFLDSAIARGDDIYIATKPTMNNLRNPHNSDGLSGFGREFKYLIDRGYVYDPVTGKICLGGCK